MSRRGNNEGSISKRKDDRWMGPYTVHTAEGPKQRAIYGKTRKEAAEKLTRVMADRDGGLVFDAENLTVGEYLDKWLKGSVARLCAAEHLRPLRDSREGPYTARSGQDQAL